MSVLLVIDCVSCSRGFYELPSILQRAFGKDLENSELLKVIVLAKVNDLCTCYTVRNSQVSLSQIFAAITKHTE